MEHIDYVTERGSGSGVKDKHTITQITRKKTEKKKQFFGACGVDGQCFPLVVLASRYDVFVVCL